MALLVAASAVSGAVGADRADAALSRSRIVSTVGGLSTADHAGGDVRQVLPPRTQGFGPFNPVWSHDGTKIAYMSDWGIWVVGADGSNPHPLVEGLRFNSPSWSADDQRIYFADLSTGHVRVGWSSLDGKSWGSLPGPIEAPHTSVAWSPDGTQFAVAIEVDGRFKTFAANADGADLRLVTEGPADEDNLPIEWSPDGRRLLVSASRLLDGFDTVVVNVDGTGRTVLRHHAIPQSWSPDGEWILWQDSRSVALSAMRSDGTDSRTLPGLTGAGDWGPGLVDLPKTALTTTPGSGPTGDATTTGLPGPPPTESPLAAGARPPAGSSSTATPTSLSRSSSTTTAPQSPPTTGGPGSTTSATSVSTSPPSTSLVLEGAPVSVTRRPAAGLAVLLLVGTCLGLAKFVAVTLVFRRR